MFLFKNINMSIKIYSMSELVVSLILVLLFLFSNNFLSVVSQKKSL